MQINGQQRYYCKACRKSQQLTYSNQAYNSDLNIQLVALLKEGNGIRSISRLLSISTNTVMRRILTIGAQIVKPYISMGKEYEMDEMCTFVGNKCSKIWIAYAIRRDTREVVDFKVGKRTNKTLATVLQTLLHAKAKRIFTDKLKNYRYLIQPKIHSTKLRATNYIERENLTIRTHLKRLSRKTICFSRRVAMLEACLAIYFWS